MAQYIDHNQVDAWEIDRLFLESRLLQSSLAQGRHVYGDFLHLAQDVFFALYKIYLIKTPQTAPLQHQMLLDPLLESPTLAKLRRRSAGSLANSYIALKRLLDFFLEQTRGRDIVAQAAAQADSRLEMIRQQMSQTEFDLMQDILVHQKKALSPANLTGLLQEIYDFATADVPTEAASADSDQPPPAEPPGQTDEPAPALFEEALQLIDQSYADQPGDQALEQRLSDTPAADQTFKGGLESEMSQRFASFLKHTYLGAGTQLTQDRFISPDQTDGPVDDKMIQAGAAGEEEVIAARTYQLSPEQSQALKDWQRSGHHQTPQPERLDDLSALTNPAKHIPWDQMLEDISRQIDTFNDNVKQLGIRPDSLNSESFDDVIDIYRRLTSPQFRQMIERIGRNKRYARQVQYRQRSRLAKPIDKVDRSNRIDDMLDEEYIQLAMADFEMDFYDRYLSDALLTTKMINQSDRRRGPIIVCYDGSGSMSGLKIQDTRTHILTLLEIARIQQRHLVIIQFASKAEPLFIKELNPLDITAGDVYDILDTFLSGGTDFELPLKKALEYIRRDHHRKSDILFFTDGLASIPAAFKHDFLAQKETYQFKLFTVIMHSLTYEDYGDIGDISDEILTIEETDIGQNHDRSYRRIYHAI